MNHEIEFKTRSTCEIRNHPIESCRKDWKKIVTTKDHDESNLGEFDIFKCLQCKLGFTDPYPTEETTGFLYKSKNSADFDIVKHTIIDKVKDYLSKRQVAQIVGSQKKVNTILDYATGNGRYALMAAEAFPNADVDAVDYQDALPQLLHEGTTRVKYLNLKDFSEKTRKYDFIILRHVLEHTHHPIELVRELATRLSPEGILYIEVPNLNSGCGKLLGKNWRGYYVPRHIYHYTSDSLTEIVNKAGLNVKIGKNEMPIMGNTISILTGLSKSNLIVQLLGVFLHPIQLIIETLSNSSTCINAKCTHTTTQS